MTMNTTRRRRRTMISTLFMVYLTELGSPTGSATGFSIKRQRTGRTTSSLGYARVDDYPVTTTATATTTLEPDLSAFLSSTNLPSLAKLAQPSSMSRLRQVMLDTYFTDSQATRLSDAIQEASRGDVATMSRTADFMLFLVETMEMGFHALLAAAFHFTSSRSASLQPFAVQDILADASRLAELQHHMATSLNQVDNAENLRNMLLTETRDWRALAIRAAACLFELKSSSTRRVQLARLALYIYAPLVSRLGLHRLKNELEGAGFKTLYRRQYDAVTSLCQEERVAGESIQNSMQAVLREIQVDMEEMLRNDPVFGATTSDFSVSARVKEPYSMWKKMLRHGSTHVLDVPDALALRIVLNSKKSTDEEPQEVTAARERALCYYAQQLCKQRWAPDNKQPRYKDYIESPKPNGYQSLHYTAMTEEYGGGDLWNLEIQVRTGEMHQVAEYGLASHWDYKSKPKTSRDYSSNAYLRSLSEWHWQQSSKGAKIATSAAATSTNSDTTSERTERIRARSRRLAPYLEALNIAQSNLRSQSVFFFVSNAEESKIVSLPSGACVSDALNESALGFTQPRLNGKSSSLTNVLSNGDVLTVSL